MAFNMKKITVDLAQNPYTVYVGNNINAAIASRLHKLNPGNFAIIISSKTVIDLYKQDIKTIMGSYPHRIVSLPDGERAKSKSYFFKVIERILSVDSWNKRIFIVCFGGGVVGDLGGFVAATYKRGIPYIQIPTTFLSQIDSSIGGKTGIDVKAAKNILGAFYQPKAVFIDTKRLDTLTAYELRQGIAEAIKYAVIADKDLFYFLHKNHEKILRRDASCLTTIVSRCAAIKARIVSVDEKEKEGLRTILNFGHTFAHALESARRYTGIAHGDAVAIGMLFAAELSLNLGLCPPTAKDEIEGLVKLFALPTSTKAQYVTLYKSMNYDKKFISGKIRMVLLRHIGKVEIVNGINPRTIKNALKSFTASI